MKNFLFESKLRFENIFDSVVDGSYALLNSLEDLVQGLPIDVWTKSFPKSVSSIPDRSIEFLLLAVVKLQNPTLLELEDLDFSKRLSVTKIDNPVFAAFLCDIQQCSSFITQQPRPFGLHLNNDAWKQHMRLRLGLFPSGLLNNSICVCDNRSTATFRHVVSCKKFLQFRSVLHNAVRDVTYEMFKSYNYSCKIEPLLKHYSDNNVFDSWRGDLIAPFLDSSQVVVDFTTVDPFAKVYQDSRINDSNGHLEKAKQQKCSNYADALQKLNENLYSKFSFVPFAISIFGNIGPTGLKFFSDFSLLCRSNGKVFNSAVWINRIMFALYRSIPKYLCSIYSKLYRDNSRVDVENLTSFIF
ncbi:hypothetical protein GEMRC1_012487 [Eukaryota sp. GEM-RC1]